MINPKVATFSSVGKSSQHIIPGAYSRSASAGTRAGFSSSGNVCILGTCLGGKPQTVLSFGGFDDAKEVVKGGSLLEVLREFFNPGHDLIPQRVFVVRVNTATQSTMYLKNGVDNIIQLKSKDYGLWTTQISVYLDDGVAVGSKVLKEKYRATEYSTRDVLKQSLSIQYVGTGTGCSAVVSNTSIATTVTGGPGGEDLTWTFANYETISDLVEAINTSGVYTAVVLTAVPEDASAQLDNATLADIMTAPVALTSNLQQLLDYINSQLVFVEASLVTGAARKMPDDIDWTRLSGGTEGSATATEWAAALTLIESADVQFVGADVSTESIGSMISAHLIKMNSVDGKSERQAIFGGSTSLTNTKTYAKTLSNYAMNLAWMDFTNYNVDGVLTDFNAVHYAAKLLGQASAVSINEPLTFKTLSVVECKTKLTKTEKEDAILAGVIVPELTASGVVRTVRSVTTYQGADIKYAEFSMVREMLYFSRDLRTLLEDTFIGQAGIPSRLVSIETVAADRLTDYETDLQIILSDPKDPTGNPAWKDFKWSIAGDVIKVEVKANIVAPINFIFQTHLFDILVSI